MLIKVTIIFCFLIRILGSVFLVSGFAEENKTPVASNNPQAVESAPTAEKTADPKKENQKSTSIFPVGFIEDATESNIFVLRSGDKINIQVFREPELSGSFTVNNASKFTYPLLGDIYVDGLSLEDLKNFLVDSLSREYLVNPQIQIIFEDSPSKSVAILGQVTRPGTYILTPNLSLLRLVSQVGGFLNTASMNNIKIVRMDKKGKKISAQVDMQSIMRGETEDVMLMPGDMVFVDKMDEKKDEAKKEIIEQVSILGQISRPGNYNYTPNMTLVRLISEAGGFTSLAAQNRVKIVRAAKDGPERSIQVDMHKVLEGKEKDVPLEPKDLVVVQESFF